MDKNLIVLLAAAAGIWYYYDKKKKQNGEEMLEDEETKEVSSGGGATSAPVTSAPISTTPMVSDSPANILFNPTIISQSTSQSGSAISQSSYIENISTQPTPESGGVDNKSAICSAMGGVYLGGGVCKKGSLLLKI